MTTLHSAVPSPEKDQQLSPIPVLTVFFTVTTIAVFLYPIVRLTPSWLQRSLNKKLVFHRQAYAALTAAVTQAHNDPEHAARLAAQRDYHHSALQALVPNELKSEADRPRTSDAA